jgi:hypothetical protein
VFSPYLGSRSRRVAVGGGTTKEFRPELYLERRLEKEHILIQESAVRESTSWVSVYWEANH